MIRLILFALSYLMAFSSFAQSEEAIVTVVYHFIHKNDLNNKNKTLRQDLMLSVGKNWSAYSNYETFQKSKKAKERIMQAFTSGKLVSGSKVKGVPRAVVSAGDRIDEVIYQNTKEGLLKKYIDIGVKTYLINSDLPKIQWNIFNEQRNFGNLKAQKAIGIYAGRKYTVWFCADLPFKNGPWKLSGLPGLILEASDEAGEVKFLFKEIYKDEEPILVSPNYQQYVTVKDCQIQKILKAFQRDPIGTFNGQLASPVDDVNLIFIDEKGNEYKGNEAQRRIDQQNKDLKLRKENPLELTK